VAVDVRQRGPEGNRRPIDPIQAGAGYLHELESLRRRAHLAGERERDQHVDVRQARRGGGLVGEDDVAWHTELGAD